MYVDKTIPIQKLGQLQVSLAQTKGDVYEYIQFSKNRDAITQNIEADLKTTDEMVASFDSFQLSKNQEDILQQFKGAYTNFQSAINEVKLFVDTQSPSKVNESLTTGNFITNFTAAQTAATQLAKSFEDDAATVNQQSQAIFVRTRWVFIGTSIFSALFAILLGLYIAGNITTPLRALSDTIKKISEGDLNLQMDQKVFGTFENRTDELGLFFINLEKTTQYLSDMAEVATRISTGDLTVNVQPKSERDVLGNAFATMVDTLNDVVHELLKNALVLGKSSAELVGSAEQAGSASSQIANTIQQVSQGINQEAEFGQPDGFFGGSDE